jgi:hypothetical protein
MLKECQKEEYSKPFNVKGEYYARITVSGFDISAAKNDWSIN